MKQWLVRRGLTVTVPVAALLALTLDACSSQPDSKPASSSERGVVDATAQGQSHGDEEIATSSAARDRLARLAQFARIVRVAKPDATVKTQARTAAKGTMAAALAQPIFEDSIRPVLEAGEVERFLKRGERVHAALSDAIRKDSIRPASVELPTSGHGFVRIQGEAAKAGVEFALKNAKPAQLQIADGLVLYQGAAPDGGDIVMRVGRETVEDFVVLEKKPAHAFLDYRVKVNEIAGLRLYANVVEFLSKDGNPEVRVSPPEVIDADGVAHHGTLTLPDCSFDTTPGIPWDRPVTSPGADECTLRVSWDDSRVVYPALVDPVWSNAASLAVGRYKNAAVRMSGGKVLTCGGLDANGDSLYSCEAYNPGTDSWATAPEMSIRRNNFTLIAIGTNVMAVGDQNSKTSQMCDCNIAGGKWTPDISALDPKPLATPPPLPAANTYSFAAANIPANQIQPALTADAAYVVVADSDGVPFSFNTSTLTWTAGVSSSSYRNYYSVFAVPSGNSILRCGGYDYSTSTAYKTCQKYTPSTNTWGAAATMNAARSNAALAGIDSSRSMLYGGQNVGTGTYIQSAEIYNGPANTWTDAGTIPQQLTEYETHNTWAIHGGTGKVATASTYQLQIFDPASSTWSAFYGSQQVGQNYTYFYTMSSQGGIAAAGNKILLVPVSPNGSAVASTTCKLFDFVQQGGFCSQTADCKSGLTCYSDSLSGSSDGQSVCCDTACTSACSSCRAQNKESQAGEGTCGPRLHTLYIGQNNCPYTDSTTCGTVGGYCDGKGACAKYDTSQACAYQGCANGVTQNNQRNCDGNGTCTALTTTDCSAGYACINSGCQTQCYDDSYCATNYFCQYWSNPIATQYTCQPRQANGKACTNFSTTECASGNCVDGYCCDGTCNGICEACSNALTGKTNGVCSAIPAGQASNNDCNDQGAGSCGQTGLCDGSRVCQRYASGTACADIGSCASETSRYVPDQCDGSGSCLDKGTQNCNVGYSCQSGVCNTSCTVDANCTSAYFCDTVTSTCVVDHKQGQTCKSDRQCEGNTNCVDGVCCDSQCGGTCRSCLKNHTGLASDGLCGNILDDTDPGNECTMDVGYPPSCEAPGTCDGTGSCRVYAKSGTVGKANTCSGITLSTYTCDGAGNLDQIESPCYPFKCNLGGTACRVACSSNDDCDDSSFCQDGKCIGQLPQGTACTDGTQCKSGFCADQHVGALEGDPTPEPGEGGASSTDPIDYPGVCCDTACGSQCEGCKKSTKGQGADGTCGKVADHTDLKNDCDSDPTKPCGFTGACDGEGKCRNVPEGTSCGVSTCIGNSARGQICDGDGACKNDSAIACSPYLCRDVNGTQQCTNPCVADDDCQDGFYCSDQECTKKLGNGATCDSAGICASGFCIDGVCCDTSCNGQCAACDNAGSEGICSAVKGEPHGNRTKCDHAGEECGGSCDGVNAAACKYVANGTVCGETTCDNGTAKSSECNGQGECRGNKDQPCSPFVCGTDDTCLTLCEQDADCSQGFTCDETTQRCLPAAVAAECSEDRLSSVGQNGISTPCKPFLCVPASGTCAVSCAFTTDCAPDFVCEASTKTCLPTPPPSDIEEESCACRTVGSTPTRHGYLALALFGLALGGLRRRVRSRKFPARSLKPSGLKQGHHPFE